MTRRVVVIAGGSAGIGRAATVAFARDGADVGVLAREPQRLEAACSDARAAGARALAVVTDVADPAQVEAAADRVERELGPIEVWVNNAMATVFGRFEDITPEEYLRVTQVTYLGAVNGTRAALKRMRPRNRGCIVQVGSALAYRSIPLQSGYCGAKAAVRAFTDSLRSELIHERSRVRITMLQFSAFNTPQFDWGRSKLPRKPQPVPPIHQPELAARAIVWASRHPRREFWTGWPAVMAILSSRVVPGLGDRLAAARAWHGQMADEPKDDAPDNLFEPVPGHFAAHGRFDDRALDRMLQLWLSLHRVHLQWALAGVAALALAWAVA